MKRAGHRPRCWGARRPEEQGDLRGPALGWAGWVATPRRLSVGIGWHSRPRLFSASLQAIPLHSLAQLSGLGGSFMGEPCGLVSRPRGQNGGPGKGGAEELGPSHQVGHLTPRAPPPVGRQAQGAREGGTVDWPPGAPTARGWPGTRSSVHPSLSPQHWAAATLSRLWQIPSPGLASPSSTQQSLPSAPSSPPPRALAGLASGQFTPLTLPGAVQATHSGVWGRQVGRGMASPSHRGPQNGRSATLPYHPFEARCQPIWHGALFEQEPAHLWPVLIKRER